MFPDEPIDGVFSDVGEAEIVPPFWVIQNVLPSGLTFLAGPAKKGKKSTLLTAFAAVVTETPQVVLPTELSALANGGNVLGFSAEASAGEVRYMAETGLGIKFPADRRFLLCDDPFAWRLDDPDASARLLKWLAYRQPRMVFIDPLRDFHTLDENEPGEMNRLLRPIQQWAKRNDAAIVVVHHTRKRETTNPNRELEADDMRGSGSLFAMADGLLIITPKSNEALHLSITIKRGKSWSIDFTPTLSYPEDSE